MKKKSKRANPAASVLESINTAAPAIVRTETIPLSVVSAGKPDEYGARVYIWKTRTGPTRYLVSRVFKDGTAQNANDAGRSMRLAEAMKRSLEGVV